MLISPALDGTGVGASIIPGSHGKAQHEAVGRADRNATPAERRACGRCVQKFIARKNRNGHREDRAKECRQSYRPNKAAAAQEARNCVLLCKHEFLQS